MATGNRKQFSAKGQKTLKSKNATLPIPFELRDQILTYILSSHSGNLVWHRSFWRPGGHFLAGSYKNEKYKPPPTLGTSDEDEELSSQFLALCSVSKQLRQDAIKVIFYRNTCQLTIELRRQTKPGNKLGNFVGWDSAVAIENLWGKEAILSIRDLSLRISNGDRKAQKQMQGYLERLVKILQKSTCLRSIDVEWQNCLYEDSIWSSNDLVRQQMNYWMGQRVLESDGTRKASDINLRGVSIWKNREEKVLEPLGLLRGIANICVRGSVTNEWAKYLQDCIASQDDAQKIHTQN